MIQLNDNECRLLAPLLERFGNMLSNEGCTDYEIDDTSENRQLLTDAGVNGGGLTLEESRETVERNARDGKIMTDSFTVLGHFEAKLRVDLSQNGELK